MGRAGDTDQPWTGDGSDAQDAFMAWGAGHLPFGTGTTLCAHNQTQLAALPWLYLKGVSTSGMSTALEDQLGPEVKACQREWYCA